MIAALRTREGQLWGALGPYREPTGRCSTLKRWAFVQRISPALADGVRRALLVGEAADPETADALGRSFSGELAARVSFASASSGG